MNNLNIQGGPKSRQVKLLLQNIFMSEVSFLTIFVHVVLSGCGIPLAHDNTVTAGSLIDLVKDFVVLRDPIQSRNSFQESANPVNKGVAVWQHATKCKVCSLS